MLRYQTSVSGFICYQQNRQYYYIEDGTYLSIREYLEVDTNQGKGPP